MTFGSLCQATGVNVETIRYNERDGALTTSARSASGCWRYDVENERTLTFHPLAREFRFGMPTSRKMIELLRRPGVSCADKIHILEEQLTAAVERIKRLTALRNELPAIVAACRTGNRIADCHIIESVAPSHSAVAKRGRS